MNEEIEMNLESKDSVLQAYSSLIALNEKVAKSGSIVLNIQYNDKESKTKKVEVYLDYQSLYVWGVGNQRNHLKNNKPLTLPNPSYQNTSMYRIPGVMTKEAIINLLDSIYEANDIQDVLMSKTTKKYENNIIMLIYIVSEAPRNELCKKVAMDVLFNHSSTSYVMGTLISNWRYSRHFLENWHTILKKHANDDYKHPIGIYHIAIYCVALAKVNPSLAKQIGNDAIALGVPISPDIV